LAILSLRLELKAESGSVLLNFYCLLFSVRDRNKNFITRKGFDSLQQAICVVFFDLFAKKGTRKGDTKLIGIQYIIIDSL